MAKSGFDFSGFWRPPVLREFFPRDGMKKGEGVQIRLNLDLLTLEFMDEVDAEFVAIFEDPAKALESKRLASAARKNPRAIVKKEEKATAAKFSMYSYERALFLFRARVLAGPADNDDPQKRLIHSWDVVDRNKKPVPVTFDAFCQMPSKAMERLYNWAMTQSSNPTADEKKESGGT